MKRSDLFCRLMNYIPSPETFFLSICELLVKVLSAGYIQIRLNFLTPVSIVIPGHSEILVLTRKQSSNLEKLAFMSLDCVPVSSEGMVLVRRGFYSACCNTSLKSLMPLVHCGASKLSAAIKS